MSKSETTDNPTTGFHRHIVSPSFQPGGSLTLCGSPYQVGMSYDGLDEAYRANVEGWASGPPCRNCLKVALIAMGATDVAF